MNNIYSLILQKEHEMRPILDREERNLMCIFMRLVTNHDSFLIRQHMRIIIYLAFIDSYELYKSNRQEFINKLKKTKKYFHYNFFYLFNEIKPNVPPLYIDYRMVNRFLEGSLPVKSTTVQTLPPFLKEFIPSIKSPQRRLISTFMYEKIKKFEVLQMNKTKNMKKINDSTLHSTLKEIVNENHEFLYDIEKRNKMINIFNFTEQLNHVPKPVFLDESSLSFSYSFHLPSIGSIENNQSHKDRIKNEVDMLNNNIKMTNDIVTSINDLKSNYHQLNIAYKLLLNEKKNEISNIIEKNHCRETILLDVDLLTTYLNEDIINYIKEFVGKKFIKNTRQLLIQQRYDLCNKENIKKMLYTWDLPDLLKFEDNYLYLKYNLKTFHEMDLYEYCLDDFLLYYNDITIGDMFSGDGTLYDLVQTKMKTINRILSIVRISNYYIFQRNVWIITNKIRI